MECIYTAKYILNCVSFLADESQIEKRRDNHYKTSGICILSVFLSLYFKDLVQV